MRFGSLPNRTISACNALLIIQYGLIFGVLFLA